MKLQQLRYICEVAKHNLNVSATAYSLFTSQPGISKQIRLLEDELGVEIFTRSGKHLTHITSAGQAIIETASQILVKVDSIKQAAREFCDERKGSLVIATTHTQARYMIPPIINRFMQHYPDVSIQMQQGAPKQIVALVAGGEVDFSIAAETIEHFRNLITIPCYHWNRCIVLPRDHPLAQSSKPTLLELSRLPIVTYVLGFAGRSKLEEAFRVAGLELKVVFTAVDADVIKAYVRLGLGVGIIASMAYEPELDHDLVALDASHLFSYSTTQLSLRKSAFLRGYMYDFIAAFAPNLTREKVIQAQSCGSSQAVESLFSEDDLPML